VRSLLSKIRDAVEALRASWNEVVPSVCRSCADERTLIELFAVLILQAKKEISIMLPIDSVELSIFLTGSGALMFAGFVLFLGIVFERWCAPACFVLVTTLIGASPTPSSGNYSTSFVLTENPISENGHWINGKDIGLKWTNVQTTPSFAFGTESGTSTGNDQYDDSCAVLTGIWGPNQTAQGTVTVFLVAGSVPYEEVEIRLLTTITADRITGYKITGSVTLGQAQVAITRWDGAIGKFKQLALDNNVPVLKTGDVLKATVTGGVITAYLNGSQVLQATDRTFTTGSPGIGFFVRGASGPNFGFSSFSATGESTPPSQTPSAPSNLRIWPTWFLIW
jgi:hypothetical protein